MYDQFRMPPLVLVQRQPEGSFERLDLAPALGHIRAEVRYSKTFLRELCRVNPGVLVVRLAHAQQPPIDHRC